MLPNEKIEANGKKPAETEIETRQEQRFSPLNDMELRISPGDGGKSVMTGYAAKYNKWSEDLGGFFERIKEGAFDEALKDCDVRALKNHDKNLLLGRTASKTLRLESNTVGLKFELDIPDTTTGRDTAEEIKRGDISGCSFAFRVGSDEWKNLEDGRVERTVTKIERLYDIGPVTYPAYHDTTVAVRSLDQFRQTASEKAAEDEQTEKETKEQKRKRRLDIESKYRRAGRIIKNNRPAED